MDPFTGRVLGMSGGFSFKKSEFNRSTQALRQPGSVFKPYIYTAAIDNNYPKTNDGDSDNTGAGTDIVTWRTSWTTGDFNANAIIGGCIHVGAASPASGTKLLSHFSITSFNKTSSDTLKIFVNHTFNGV